MAIDVSYLNYGYSIDQTALKDNIKLVLSNAQKNSNTAESIIEQKAASSNSALLFEYTQGIANTNVAQQLVLDANLKETLKFLNSQAAKRMLQSPKKKFGTYVEHIFTENNMNDFKSDNKLKEDDVQELIDLFEIEIDNSKENIFAA